MSENTKLTVIDFGKDFGSLWTPIMAFISAITLIYLSLWGKFNNNTQATSVVIIFGLMLTIPMILLSGIAIYQLIKNFNSEKWFGDNSFKIPALGFIIGFWIQAMIVLIGKAKSGFSILSIQQNSLLSSFSTQLPSFWEFFINAIMVPIIEEFVWIFFIPQVLFILFWVIGKKISFLNNTIFKLIFTAIVVGISSWTFAQFHIGQTGNIGFFISAMIFRTILIVLFWGDLQFDLIKWANIGFSMLVGFHIGNNWMTYGFFYGINTLLSNFFGIMVLILLWVIQPIVAFDASSDRIGYVYTLIITGILFIVPIIIRIFI